MTPSSALSSRTGLALLLLCSIGAAFPALAAPGCVERAAADHSGLPIEDVPLVEEVGEPIFVELGADAAVGDIVRFEIRVGDEVELTEEIELFAAPDGDAVAVVELLAAQPNRREALRRASRHALVEVTLVRDGLSSAQTFDGLAEHSAALLADGALPFGIRSTVTTTATGSRTTKSTCEQYCLDLQDDCYIDQCRFGGNSCYDQCDLLYENCLESCGICQTSTSSTTSSTIVSTTATSVVQCRQRFGDPTVSGQQRQFDRRIKHTTTTTTINSDCSRTVTTSVTYQDTFCWKWINFNGCTAFFVENPAANC